MSTTQIPFESVTHENGRRRSTKATVEQRILTIMGLLLSGAGWTALRSLAERQGWGVSDSALHRYLKAAYQAIRKDLERRRHNVVALHEAKLRYLWSIALKEIPMDGYKAILTALEILRHEAKVQGLLDPKVKGRYRDKSSGQSRADAMLDEFLAELRKAHADLEVPIPSESTNGQHKPEGSA